MSVENLPSVFDLLDVLAETFVFVGHAFKCQHVLDSLLKRQPVDGLGEKIVRTRVNGSLDVAQFIKRRDHQDHDVLQFRVALDLLTHFKPTELGHHDVQQNQIRLE